MVNNNTLFVNRILVLVTFSIMIISILSCIFMYIFRDYQRKEVPTIANDLRGRVDAENETQKSHSGPVEPSYQSGSFLRGNESSSGNESSNHVMSNPNSSRTPSDEDLETDPLMSNTVRKSNAAPETEEGSIAKRNLNESIEIALSVGVTLTLHTLKHSRSATLNLVDDTLICRVRKSAAMKVVQIKLGDITAVLSGKATSNFRQSNLQTVPPDVCFSIVTATKTLDFEAMYKTERDALASGLRILVEQRIL